jgi:L-2,4-diaminobutyric acid acetyltransferase
MKVAIESSQHQAVFIRHAQPEDGKKIWSLIRDIGVLDLNSVYCYLLLCRHFSKSCLVAEDGKNLAGFITTYKVPEDETTLFIWQIGVAENARHMGLAKKLIMELLQSDYCKFISRIQATVSPSNTASLSLFKSLSRDLNTTLTQTDYFDTALFPVDQHHEKEMLLTVGPF